ncbi:citrate lyase holo-[acyl-carrier protein] synthase [Vibrio mediterranei]
MSIRYGLNVGLDDVLSNKEARVKRQGEWSKHHSLPLLSFTVNMPGPRKMTECTERIFEQGVRGIQAVCHERGWVIAGRQLLRQTTGPEAIFAVRAPNAKALKRAMIEVEKNHHLGRLMDLDVIDVDGKIISRKGQGMARRKCLICEQDAAICARSRKHDLQTLVSHIESMVCYDECCP